MRARRRPAAVASVVLLALGAVLAGCSAPGAAVPDRDAGTRAAVRLPPTTGGADYQLGGAYAPPAGTTVVARDSTGRPAEGIYSICYVNGFQTQPDERAAWLRDHSDAILRTADGSPRIDPGWPDEYLLDVSTPAKRAEIAAVREADVRRCAASGFAAVEFDNLDSWTRSHGAFGKADALAMATALVQLAHDAGLAAGQKNAAELRDAGRTEAGYDFAVAEECIRYTECGAYRDVYGAHVIDIEYTDDASGPIGALCAAADRPALTVLRDRDLVAAGEPAYAFARC